MKIVDFGVARLLAPQLVAHRPIANTDSLFVAQRFCERCTDDRLAALIAEVTAELLERAAAGSGQTVLVIKLRPPNARAYVDAA